MSHPIYGRISQNVPERDMVNFVSSAMDQIGRSLLQYRKLNAA